MMDIRPCYPKPAVSALIVRDGEVLLVKRGCEPNMGLWSLPGGSIELGETLREALVREVYEETSLVVESGNLALARDIISRDDEHIRFHYVLITLYAAVTGGELKAGSDAADARWVGVDRLGDYAITGGLMESLRELGIVPG